eukprot:3862059-Amphidinium_carterae.5
MSLIHVFTFRPNLDPYLSIQVTETPTTRIVINKDKRNINWSWVTSLEQCEGGSLWIEVRENERVPGERLAPPPTLSCDEKHEGLMGRMVNTRGVWFKFIPQNCRAMSPVHSGRRISTTAFSSRDRKRYLE